MGYADSHFFWKDVNRIIDGLLKIAGMLLWLAWKVAWKVLCLPWYITKAIVASRRKKLFRHGLELLIESGCDKEARARWFLGREKLLLIGTIWAAYDTKEVPDNTTMEDIIEIRAYAAASATLVRGAKKLMEKKPYSVTDAQKLSGQEQKIQRVAAKCEALGIDVPDFRNMQPAAVKAMVVGDPLLRLMSRDTDEALMKCVLEDVEFEGLVQKAIIDAENASRNAKYWNAWGAKMDKKWK